MRKYFHRIDLLENKASNELAKPNWKRKLSAFADIAPISSASAELEGLGFGHVLSEELYRFKTRFHKQITRNLRIFFEGKIYAIKRVVDPDSRRRYLDIYALLINNEDES